MAHKYKIDRAPRRKNYIYGIYEKRWWGWSCIYVTDYRYNAEDYKSRLMNDIVGLPEYF